MVMPSQTINIDVNLSGLDQDASSTVQAVSRETVIGTSLIQGPRGPQGEVGVGIVLNAYKSAQKNLTGSGIATLTGAVDGINPTFLVPAGKYAAGTLQVYCNGVLQPAGDAITETIPASGFFAFVTPPPTATQILVTYQTQAVNGTELADVAYSGSKADVGLGNVPNTDFTAAVAANTAKNSYPTADAAKLAAITGTNTGDETTATIKTKLGITTLSGSNTGDQDLSTYALITSVTPKADKTYVDSQDAAIQSQVTTNTTDIASNTSAIALKAPTASPTLTGTPTAPTATPSTNNTQIASTAYADAAAIAAVLADALHVLIATPRMEGPVTLSSLATRIRQHRLVDETTNFEYYQQGWNGTTYDHTMTYGGSGSVRTERWVFDGTLQATLSTSGLTISNKLIENVVTVTASSTMASTTKILRVNSASPTNQTLPTPTTGVDRIIKNRGAGLVTLIGTIDGSTSNTLAQNKAIRLMGNGTDFDLIGVIL